MNKEQLRKEIFERVKVLNDKVKLLEYQAEVTSVDANDLLNKSVILYERLVLFNYLDGVSSVIPKETESKNELSTEGLSDTSIRSGNNSIGSKFKKAAIDNIRTTIGINERFRFANELFEGSIHELGAALSQLDSIKELSEALRYMDSLNNIYKWKSDLPAYIELIELIHRRFNSPEK